MLLEINETLGNKSEKQERERKRLGFCGTRILEPLAWDAMVFWYIYIFK